MKHEPPRLQVPNVGSFPNQTKITRLTHSHVSPPFLSSNTTQYTSQTFRSLTHKSQPTLAMATTLLKKVWESVSNRSNSTSNSTSNTIRSSSSSYYSDIEQIRLHTSFTGAFDRIPVDIFIQILKLIGPKETAKLSVVCKYWKFVVSDNRLWIYFLQNASEQPWDSVFFAENYLRSGYHHLLYVFDNIFSDICVCVSTLLFLSHVHQCVD